MISARRAADLVASAALVKACADGAGAVVLGTALFPSCVLSQSTVQGELLLTANANGREAQYLGENPRKDDAWS